MPLAIRHVTGRCVRGTTLGATLFLAAITSAPAQQAPGVTDTTIKIGQTVPYSGPASVSGANGVADVAFTKSINDQGGINGRKIELQSLDDAFSPPKTIEQTRALVEQEQVAFIYRSIGTATQVAISKYLNDRKVPQLFIGSSASAWNDPVNHHYSMGGAISYEMEAAIYARYAVSAKPNAKMAVLYQNDDLGKDYLAGIKETTGTKTQIVAAVSYEITDPTVDSQIATLQASGAEVFASFSTPKATSQAIRRAFDTGWKPQIIIPLIVAQIDGTLKPAGLDKAVGVISEVAIKDAADPQWAKDPDMIAFQAWRTKYNSAVPDPALAASGYNSGYMISQVIKQAGDNLTRENIMKQAANLKDVHPPMNLPGINVETTPDNFRLARKVQFQKFNGTNWELIGTPVSD